MNKFLPGAILSSVITLVLIVSLGIGTVYGQTATPTAEPTESITPTETPSETPTPTEEPSPTSTEKPTPTPEVTPTPEETEGANEESDDSEEGEVLGGATELGGTDSGRQMKKWTIAAFIGVAVTLAGIRISKIRAEE